MKTIIVAMMKVATKMEEKVLIHLTTKIIMMKIAKMAVVIIINILIINLIITVVQKELMGQLMILVTLKSQGIIKENLRRNSEESPYMI